MGCATSKKKLCDKCQRPCSPVGSRSYSMHVHQPRRTHEDSYNAVALTSSTLGSLDVQIDDEINGNTNGFVSGDGELRLKEFSVGLMEAKAWSDMIDEKIPKIVPRTPIRTPPGEPETINTWELMEGLDDFSPFRLSNHLRSFSFDVGRCQMPENFVGRKSNWVEYRSSSPKPPWLQMEDGDLNSHPIISEFDPDVISAFRRAMEDLSPENSLHLLPFENPNRTEIAGRDPNGISLDSDPFQSSQSKEKEKVVVYFTSLRGIRKTYEDCCNVKMILKSMGVRVDERDVSMHSGFKEELRELLGKAGINGGGMPRVFVGGKYIGGADEIQRLHEDGDLEKLLEWCEKEEEGGGRGGGGGACEVCGDIRFVPCKTCSGSCKVYHGSGSSTEEEDEEEEEEEATEDENEEEEYGFKRCQDCNENGLIRCPICCN